MTTEHKALTALRDIVNDPSGAHWRSYTRHGDGDQPGWLSLAIAAIPALEALIAERDELRGELGNLLHFTAPATDGIDPVALRRSRAAAIALLAKGDA